MKIAVATRGELLGSVLECVDDELKARFADPPRVIRDPADSKQMRHQIYKAQPQIVLLDEHVGTAKGWRSIASVPRLVAGVRTCPRVIALLMGLTEKRERLAAMAGCYDAVDLTDPSWRDELREAIRVAARARARPFRAAENDGALSGSRRRFPSKPRLA
jgi:DNA-binding NarL/FixJ family response regulator